jgi:lysophospholipase L1-like esterase/quinol monooxygenase YgiN
MVAASAAFGELVVKDGDTLAFLGDSITQHGQEKPDGYVNLVLRSLALDGVYVKPVKAGISGNKSTDMLARLEKQVLSKKPNVMTFSCGVNDVWHHDWNKGVSIEDYKKNVSEIFDKCDAADCKVVVLTATMFEKAEMEKFKHNVMIASYNEWLRGEAKRRGYPVADLNADMWKAHADNPSVKLTYDGVHMRPEGNRLMARGVLRALGMAEDRVASFDWENWKPVWVLCRFDLKPDAARADYLAKTKGVLAAVRAEPGCCEYRLLGDAETDWTKPQRFGDRTLWMLEKWLSVEELKAHLDTPHMKAFGPSVGPMRASSSFHVLEDVLQ